MPPFFGTTRSPGNWDETILADWIAIDTSYRDKRRFLEAHSELVDPRSLEYLEQTAQANGDDLENVEMLWAHWQIMADAVGRGGDPCEAVRQTYMNRHGAIALELPTWLEQLLDRFTEPLSDGEAPEERLQLVRAALDRLPTERLVDERLIRADLQLRLVDLLNLSSQDDSAAFDEAIQACLEACDNFSPSIYPLQHASGQFYLGAALATYPGQPNYEGARRAYTTGLTYMTCDDAPELWAEVQKELATVYYKCTTIAPEERSAGGIAAAKAALNIFTEDTFPEEWASLQNLRGIFLQGRLTGGQRENLEQAIAALVNALRVFTEQTHPEEFAMAQNNLGVALRERIAGDPIANAEFAMGAHLAALRVYTRDRYPEDYAMTMFNLANASLKRHALPLRLRIGEAITGYRAALTVFTREQHPESYAMVQNSLGVAHVDTLADPYTNIELAIKAYREALGVYTPEAYPSDHAMVMGNLGNAFMRRKVGPHEQNVREAVAHYDVALRLHDAIAYPLEHRIHQLAKALALAECGDWSAAHAAYQAALSIEERLLGQEVGEEARAAMLREGRDTSLRDGYALAQLGRGDEAAVAVERGRARGLMESFALDAADPERINDASRRARFIEARERFTRARADLFSEERPVISQYSIMSEWFEWDRPENSNVREAAMKRAEAFRAAQDALDTVLHEVHNAGDPDDFLQETLDKGAILRQAQACGDGHALVYLAATPWGGLAVGAFAANSRTGGEMRIATLNLPALTHDRLAEMTQTKVSEEMLEVLGGFTYAQRADGLHALELPSWTRGQQESSFRQRAQAIYDASVGTGRPSTISVAAQTALGVPELREVVDRPLASLDAADRGGLDATMNHRFLQAELHACLPKLASMAMQPLATWLKKESVASVTLIPCGFLESYPLLAVSMTDGRTFADTFYASVAPSSRALRFERPEHYARAGVYALGDPVGAAGSLPWSEAEALAIAKLARLRGLHGEARVQQRATRAWLNTAFAGAAVVDASCHGQFDPLDFLRSGLLLAGGESLTMADLLSSPGRLKGLRLLILSACQTAIPDVRGQTDEVRSIAAASIQAGASAVLGALWPVDDRATFILIVRFMQEWLPVMHQEPPAFALARAQKWLRTATNRKLRAWQIASLVAMEHAELEETGVVSSSIPLWHRSDHTPEGERLQLRIRGGGARFAISEAERKLHQRANSSAANDVPYADPIYWAAFQIVGW